MGDSNKLIPVTQKVIVPNFPPLLATATMNNKYYGKCIEYPTTESLGEILYDQGVMDNGIHKLKYHWEDFSWSIKIKVNGVKLQ